MKIAMLASESNPFAKTGGLADVVYALSEELSKEHEVCVFMPLYPSLWKKKGFAPLLKATFPVIMNWRRQQATLYALEKDGIVFYFIHNPYYFDRENLYGYQDDGERFAFLSLAFVEALKVLDFKADIVHIHDWQAGMVPCIVREGRRGDPFFQRMRFVFTIHNPAFKGYLAKDSLFDLYDLPPHLFDIGTVRLNDMVSTLKSGLVYADKISTVSPTHREELLHDPQYGLSGVLEFRKDDFVGIVNGIDINEWDPAKDAFLNSPYSKTNFATKKSGNRDALLEAFSLPKDGGAIYGVVSRLTDQKGIDLIADDIHEILANNSYLVVLGSGDPRLEARMQAIRNAYPDRVGVYFGYGEKLSHLIYAGSSFFLMPSLFEPCGISQMIAKRYGSLPIVRETGGLVDTVRPYPEDKKADGIRFRDFNDEGLSYAVQLSHRLYEDKKAYDSVVRRAMACDHSWRVSAEAYYALYLAALEKN